MIVLVAVPPWHPRMIHHGGVGVSIQLSYPHVEKPVGEPARLVRTPRIHVAHIVMDYLAYGWSVDEMCRQHTYLDHSEAHAAMAYYFDHQAEIDAEIVAECEEVKQSRAQAMPSRVVVRMRSEGLI